MNKNIEEAYKLIEEVASNQYEQRSEEEYKEEDKGTYSTTQIELLIRKVETLDGRTHFNLQLPHINTLLSCENCGNCDHLSQDCVSITSSHYAHETFTQAPIQDSLCMLL